MTEENLRHELGLFFHRELDARYDPEYLRGIPEVTSRGLLEEVSQQDLKSIKGFFKRVMYPVGTERRLQDRHMDAVMSLLSSPSSVVAFLSRLPGLLVRHGRRLAGVSRAGMRVVSAYKMAQELEDRVLASLVELCESEYEDVDDAEDLPDTVFRRAYATVHDKEVREMVDLTEQVAHLGADERLIAATTDVIESVQDHLDDPSEKAALEYVRSVTEDVQRLSRKFSRRQIDRTLELSRLVEFHYFDNLLEA